MAKSASVSQKKELPKEFDLGFELKNFGPIAHADIKLKPLTVFIGPNNSGKSYAALVVKSVLNQVEFPSHLPDVRYGPQTLLLDRDFLIGELVRNAGLLDLEQSLSRGGRVALETSSVEHLTHAAAEFAWTESLNIELLSSFGKPLADLSAEPRRPSEIAFTLPNFTIRLRLDRKRDRFAFVQADLPKLDITASRVNDELEIVVEFPDDSTAPQILRTGRLNYISEDKKSQPEYIVRLILNHIEKCLTRIDVYWSHYLPPSRSGLLAGHKALAAAVLKQASYASMAATLIPDLPPTAANFLADLLTLPSGDGPFATLCDEFQESMTSGQVVLEASQGRPFPDIKYRFGKRQIPLHKASSMVSELAPLFLFLKYKVREGDVLIIEEPESHLHPGVQRKLAWLLTRLVRRGVRVLITTHSEYLLEQLGNFVMMSKIPGRRREQTYGYAKEDYLLPEEMATYLFKFDKRRKGFVTNLLKATAEQGFSEQGFGKVYDELYEESVKLEREAQDEEPSRRSGVKK